MGFVYSLSRDGVYVVLLGADRLLCLTLGFLAEIAIILPIPSLEQPGRLFFMYLI